MNVFYLPVRKSGRIVCFSLLLSCIATLLFGLAGASVASANPVQPVTIPTVTEAIVLALENSAQVTSARRQLEEAGAGHASAVAGLLGWRLDAHLNDRLAEDNQLSSLFQTDDPVNALSATIALRKALGIGPKTGATLRESNLMVEQSQRELLRTISDTIVETYDAYRQLQLLLLRYDLAKRAVRVAEQGWQAADDQLSVGAIAPTDAQEAYLGVIEAQNNVQSARYFLEVAWRRLAHMIGVDPASTSIDDLPIPSLDDLWDVVRRRDRTFWPDQAIMWDQSPDEMIQYALEHRSEVADAQAFMTLAEIGIEKTRLDKRPVFQVQAQYNTTDDIIATLGIDNEWVLTTSATKTIFSHEKPAPPTESQFPPPAEPTWEVTFSVTFNLWDSGHHAYALRRGESALERSMNTLDQAKQGIELDVLNRHAQVLTAFDALRLATERALLAYGRVGVEQEKRSLGMSTDLLVSQQEIGHWSAVIEAVSKRFEYETSLLKLKDGQGVSPEQLYEIAEQLSAWDPSVQ